LGERRSEPDEYKFVYNGVTYNFGKDEFPEYRDYMEHNKDADFSGLAYTLSAIKARAHSALVLLPESPK
jgi:hypothetical protein